MKHNSSIAIIGLGNILLHDEGTGVIVIEDLQQQYIFYFMLNLG
jgi:Ni,Fe-hydrogenase maturation factor